MLDFAATKKRYRGDAVGAIVNKNRASRKYHRIRIVRDEAARLNNLIYRFYRYTAPYLSINRIYILRWEIAWNASRSRTPKRNHSYHSHLIYR